jgi:hypothetical protein
MLFYDMQALSVDFFPPADAEDRPRWVVTIAELIVMIATAQQKGLPKWKRYYLAHHEEELARQRAYRVAHKEQVREYNQQYYQARRRRKDAVAGQGVRVQQAAKCST